jgi:hypothetical protein
MTFTVDEVFVTDKKDANLYRVRAQNFSLGRADPEAMYIIYVCF